MNKFDCKAIASAIGPRDGDFLELSNLWARVVISRDCAAGQPDSFTVRGDLADDRLRIKEFDTLTDAMSYAMRSLAQYQAGRLN